eukprot:CAMPEP_0198569066 /NCGR_PEP_ID=MMETSP1462-20131121/107301_1 /TAXON_ID=1333877 /ORGANISM="Brandtodinium nutriculum, Strain RCC3387" /LENGTH=90 /DNA_ID=CAMNT_0044300147 /DNA_START=440 /DNA_END=712 /DNA_ORIENTATION=-
MSRHTIPVQVLGPREPSVWKELAGEGIKSWRKFSQHPSDWLTGPIIAMCRAPSRGSGQLQLVNGHTPCATSEHWIVSDGEPVIHWACVMA